MHVLYQTKFRLEYQADIAAEGRVSSKSVYHGLKSSLQKIKQEKQIFVDVGR